MGSSVEIRWLSATVGIADGVDVKHEFFNATDKEMKYITFAYVPYNRVGDQVSCTVSGKVEALCELTGPIKPYKESSVKWDAVWYNPTVSDVKLLRVHIIYMDGTEEEIDGADVMDMSDEQSVYYEKIQKPEDEKYAALKKKEEEARAKREKEDEAQRIVDARNAELIRAYQFFNVFKCFKQAATDKEMAFHANQGLWLFIMEVIAVICGVVIPGYGTIALLGLMVLAIFLSSKAIGGIKDGKKFEIPVISKIKLIK